MAKEAKTNAMRMLERAKVAYTAHEYPHEILLSFVKKIKPAARVTPQW